MSRTAAAAALLLIGSVVSSVTVISADTSDCRRRGDTLARQFITSGMTIDADTVYRLAGDRIVIFTGSVVARRHNVLQCADRFEVHLADDGTGIVSTIAAGNVRVVTSDCREGIARRAEFRDFDQRLVLSGNARLRPDEGWPAGDDIFIYLPRAPATSPWRCAAAATDRRAAPR